ncbi:MAG: hypothetical protein EZS28_035195, partial [Streblomastix strix]
VVNSTNSDVVIAAKCVWSQISINATKISMSGGLRGSGEFNLKNVSVPDRLTIQIHEWDFINGGYYVRMGATPNWTSIEALQQLEAMQHYDEYHGPKRQMLEYQNPLIKEILVGIAIETDNIRIINPTFLDPKTRWETMEDLGMQKYQLIDDTVEVQNGRNRSLKVNFGTFKFRNNSRSIRCLSPNQSVRSVSTIFRFCLHGEDFCQQRSTVRLSKQPIHIQQDDITCDQSDQKKMDFIESVQLHKRLKFNSEEQNGIEENYPRSNLFSQTVKVEALDQETQHTSINYIQVPRFAMVFDTDRGSDAIREKKIDQNSNYKMDSSCQESTNYSIERSCEFDRRVEFSMVSVPECFIKSELIESTEMLSNWEGRLELQSEIDQKNPQQSPLIADSCLREQTKEITGTTINSNSNYRCSRIWMGLNFSDSESDVDGCRQVEQQLAFEQQQLMGNSCSLGITPIVSPILIQGMIKCLTLKTDNQTVEYSLRKWKGSSNRIHLIRALFKLLDQLKISLVTVHIPGQQNSSANASSKLA